MTINMANKAPMLLALLMFFFMPAGSAIAAQIFANWTTETSFELGAITAAIATSNNVNATDTLLRNTPTLDGQTNYDGGWFTPQPPQGTLWSTGGIENMDSGSTGSIDVTLTFSAAVPNPRFHFYNLDNGTVSFGAIPFDRLSGNPEFEVSGAVINSTPNSALNGGCEDELGGNGNGACGTVQLQGTFSSITFTVTDSSLASGGDGFGWTVSYDQPTISIDDVTVEEADGVAILTISLSAALPSDGADVSVDYTTTDGTAVAPDDYTGTAGTATIPAGETSVTIDIPIIDDGLLVEDEFETFTLDLSNPANATIADGQGVVTIVDSAEPIAIPTLGQWTMILLGSLLAMLGIGTLRRAGTRG